MPKQPSAFKQTVVKGTNRDDTLVGGSGADRLVGGGGDDMLVAAWNDVANTPSGYLIYDGGIGVDTLDFSSFGRPGDQGIAGDLGRGYIYRQQDQTYFGDLYDPQLSDRLSGSVSGIENLIGTNASDYFIGSVGDNILDGRGGNDVLTGGMGNNVLIGGAGDDHLYLSLQTGTNTGDGGGGAGNDIFYTMGNMAGVYSVNRITDFDLRSGESDAQFDKLYVSDDYSLDWGEENGTLVAYQSLARDGQAVGKILFEGITLADINAIAVYSVDISGGGLVTPMQDIAI